MNKRQAVNQQTSPVSPKLAWWVQLPVINQQISLASRNLTWWEHILFEQPLCNVLVCPDCQALNGSIDVVCRSDSCTLVGANASHAYQVIVINALRLLVLTVVMLTAYFGWWLPVYGLTCFVIVVFFGLFLRHHRKQQLFFVAISTAGFVWHGLIGVLGKQNLYLRIAPLLVLCLLLVMYPVFLFCCSRRSTGMLDNPRERWFQRHGVDESRTTFAWICFMASVGILLLSGWFMAQFLKFPEWGGVSPHPLLELGLIALGASQTAILVSSTIGTLHGAPFSIADRWQYRPLVRDTVKLNRIHPHARTGHSIVISFATAVDRVASQVFNGILRTFEDAYAYFAKTVNILLATTVTFANSLRRFALLVLRHLIRGARRAFLLLTWSISWVWEAGKGYYGTFGLPLLLSWLSGFCVHSISIGFVDYMHEGKLIIPLGMTLDGAIIVALFTATIGFTLHTNIAVITEGVTAAIANFGAKAFLFLVGMAWTLGIIGMTIGGPFGIGWVTIISTAVTVIGFLWARRLQVP